MKHLLLVYRGGLKSASVPLKNDRFQNATDLLPQIVEAIHYNQDFLGALLDVGRVRA